MTNVSKNMLFALVISVSAAVLALGAFATTAYAANDDYGAYDGGGWSDYSSYGGWSDYSDYGGGFSDYSAYDGWSDYSNYGGYNDYSSYDSWSDYSDYSGYSDYSAYDGWSDYSTNTGSYEEYNPGFYEEYNPGYYEEYNPGYYEEYAPEYAYEDSYVSEYMEEYAASKGYSTGGGYSFGGFSFPTYYSTPGCTNCHSNPPAPCYTCNQPKPTCTTCGGSNTNITNVQNTSTLIDNSIVDNSINIVDNSINDSFNTTVIGDGNVVGAGYQGIAIGGAVAQQHYAAPYCVITLTNAGVYSTQATLVWSSSNATSAYISSIGSVAVNGTRVVTGYANQIYSLTVTGQGGSYTCQTQVFTSTYIAPTITPSVSLTQIPYTGLALGPVGQALYWLSLFSVAAAGAYLLVYYKGGALAFATAAMNRQPVQAGRSNHLVVSEQETEEVAAPVHTEEAAVSPVTVLNFLPAMAETKTRDVMSMVRSTDGTPRIVIARA